MNKSSLNNPIFFILDKFKTEPEVINVSASSGCSFGKVKSGWQFTPNCATLLKEVNGFDVSPELISTEDYDLWIRLAAKSNKFAFIDEPLGEYHRHDNNVSANIEKHLMAELALLAKHFSTNTRYENVIARRRRTALAYYGAGRSLHRTSKHFLALKKYAHSLIIWPISLRLYAAVALSLMGFFTPKSK